MTEEGVRTPHRIVRWLAWGGAVLGIGAPFAALAMALLTGAGILAWQISLGSLFYLPWAAMAGGALALLALIALLVRRYWRRLPVPLLSILVAAAFVSMVSYNFGKATTVPPIHDISTDLSNPPAFDTLELRADNRALVPDGGRADLAAMDPAARWRTWHEEGYPDIATIRVPASVPDTIAAAEALVEERGWELAVADPATGRLEATDTVSIYRFKDDVVLRVVPSAEGPGSVVDMRSVSRVGISDLGVNAERVRAFLADLQAVLGD